jgi:hypothetical protein
MFLNLDLDIVRYFYPYERITYLGNLAQQSTICNNFITLAQSINHLLVLPGLLHLWPDKKKIKYYKDQDKWQQPHHPTTTGLCGLLGPGILNKNLQHVYILKFKTRYYDTDCELVILCLWP